MVVQRPLLVQLAKDRQREKEMKQLRITVASQVKTHFNQYIEYWDVLLLLLLLLLLRHLFTYCLLVSASTDCMGGYVCMY